MFSRRLFLPSVLALAGLSSGATCGRAQNTTINLSGATRVQTGSGVYSYTTWKPILAPTGWSYRTSDGYLYDAPDDQQTGQSDSDFAGSTQNPSFFIQTGTINGVEMVAMRVIFNSYDANIANGNYTGNPVNVRVGIDATGDGKLDLFMGPNFQGTPGLVFQLPGSGANTSPSTTSTSTVFYPDGVSNNALSSTSSPAFSSSNFNYQRLSSSTASSLYPGWVLQPEDASKPTQTGDEGMMSWAIPVSAINNALAEAATQSGLSYLSSVSISPSSFLMWVAFTATQNNSVNQDAYGIKSSDSQSTAWSSVTTYMDAYGRPVPEPAAYGLLLGGGLCGFLMLRRRGKRVA